MCGSLPSGQRADRRCQATAGETDLKQRHGSRLGVSPAGTMTRRQGNADLRSAQPRGSAAGEMDLKQQHGSSSNAYFNRSSGADAGLPPVGSTRFARLRRAVPGSTGRTAQRSAVQAVPAIWRGGGCAVRCPPGSGADRRSAFQAVPALEGRWGTAKRVKNNGSEPPVRCLRDRGESVKGARLPPSPDRSTLRHPRSSAAGEHSVQRSRMRTGCSGAVRETTCPGCQFGSEIRSSGGRRS